MESFGFVGIMIAALTTGILADRYGRRHVLMASLALTVLSALFESFSSRYVSENLSKFKVISYI